MPIYGLRLAAEPGGFGGCGDLFSDEEGCGGSGAGCVEDVDEAVLVGDFEVVGEGAVSAKGLGSDSGSSSDELIGFEVGHQALEGVDEGGLVGAAPDFSETGLPVVSGEAEEAGPGEGVGGVADVDVAPAVALTLEGEDGVGSGLDGAVESAGEVDAEEGEGRVGDGIDEVVEQVSGGGDEVVVLAAEGDDAEVSGFGRAGASGYAVGLESGAVDGVLRSDGSGSGCELDAVGVDSDGADAGFEAYGASGGFEEFAVPLADASVVGDAG